MSSETTAFPLPLGPGVRVLAAHASGLVALEKPEGVMAHPNTPDGARNALLTAAYDADAECYRFADASGASRRVWLLNRLDSPTSGVLLAATDEATARAVKALFAGREIDKTYLAVVKGAGITPPAGVWRDRLDKRHAANHVRAAAGASGLEAVTHYDRLRTNRELPALSLIRLEPKTGRTHQLRIQSATHGHPIVGDKTYGDFTLNKALAARDRRLDRLFLHCARTALRFALGGRTVDFVAESPTPPEFELLLCGATDRAAVSDRLTIRVRQRK